MQNGCAVGSSRQAPSVEAERRERPARRSAAARPGRTSRAGTRRRPRARCATSSVSAGRRIGEHLAHLGRRHARLVVVEQRRVRQVGRLEALDVAALQLDVLAQVREEGGEVVVPPRLDPGVVAARGGARHLDPELGRHAARLLPVAARDADQARVVGVVGQRLLERCEPVEQASDLGVGEAIVDDAAERGERLGARLGPERRHRHALLPAEHAGGAAEVGDLREPLAERWQDRPSARRLAIRRSRGARLWQ